MIIFANSNSSKFVIFFFSSRRRHTRWPRDWSSDVCSSDLITAPRVRRAIPMELKQRPRVKQRQVTHQQVVVNLLCLRSEERRVGKECRARRWRYHQIEKQGESGNSRQTTKSTRMKRIEKST